MTDTAAARSNMVESQLRTNKVTDAGILAAFEAVPRELFVPEDLRGIAYVDEDIPLGHGRHVMEPMILARLLQAAAPRPGDMALDLGCGTGYVSAILARLAGTVVALESDHGFVERANRTLSDLGVDNTVVVEGLLREGCPRQAPYDVILINGAVGEVPAHLAAQLAEGGRLVTVVREASGPGRAKLLQKTGGVVSGRVVFDASVPFLPEFEPERGFVF